VSGQLARGASAAAAEEAGDGAAAAAARRLLRRWLGPAGAGRGGGRSPPRPQVQGVYPEGEILQAKIDMLQKTNMVDFAMDIHTSLHGPDAPCQGAEA